MKELKPNKKSEIVPFSISTQECLDKACLDVNVADISVGCIFESGGYACIAKGSSLEIVNVKSGHRKAAWDFSSNENKQTVTCLCQCGGKFLIGLQCHNSSQCGMICVYDPGVSRVIKAISLPSVPLSLYLIKESGGAGEKSTLLK